MPELFNPLSELHFKHVNPLIDERFMLENPIDAGGRSSSAGSLCTDCRKVYTAWGWRKTRLKILLWEAHCMSDRKNVKQAGTALHITMVSTSQAKMQVENPRFWCGIDAKWHKKSPQYQLSLKDDTEVQTVTLFLVKKHLYQVSYHVSSFWESEAKTLTF